ncbi:MAG: hypothetical protein ACKOBV_10800, partial [Candidatus Kapaibacterium sp.]
MNTRSSFIHIRTALRACLTGTVALVLGFAGVSAQSSLDSSYPVQMGVYGVAGRNFQPTSNLYFLSGFPRPMTPFNSGQGD